MAAIPTIMKGDRPPQISIVSPDAAVKAVVEYQGVTREYANIVAGGTMPLQFTAEETAALALGAFPVKVVLHYADGGVKTCPLTAKIKVTDCPGEVYNAVVDISGGTAGFDLSDVTIDEGASQATINEVISKIVRKGGGTVIPILLALAAPFAVVAEHVYPVNPAADKGAFFGQLNRDTWVSTNTASGGGGGGAPNYAAVSNAAMTAVQSVNGATGTAVSVTAADIGALKEEAPSYAETGAKAFWSESTLKLNAADLEVATGKVKVDGGWSKVEANDQTLPNYLKGGAWNTAADKFAKESQIPSTANFATKGELRDATNAITAASIGALPTTGGTVSGDLSVVGAVSATELSSFSRILASSVGVSSWNMFTLIDDSEQLPDYLKSGDWNTASDPFAKVSQVPSVAGLTTSNEVESIVASHPRLVALTGDVVTATNLPEAASVNLLTAGGVTNAVDEFAANHAAPVASSGAIVWSANPVSVTLATGAALSCTGEWPYSKPVFVRVTPNGTYSPAENLRLIGYGGWPTNVYQAVVWRANSTYYVNVIVED